jgi:hypothetical protein
MNNQKPKIGSASTSNLTTTTNEDKISPSTFNFLSENLKKYLIRIQNIFQIQKPIDGIWSPEIKTLFIK